MAKENRKEPPTRACCECGKDYKSRYKICEQCRYKLTKRNNCSCGNIKFYSSPNCKDCNKSSGIDNPNWKDGRITSKKGYIYRHCPGHPKILNKTSNYVAEHHLVMEEHIGRYLEPKETVHHRNGQKNDNRLDNLELWVSNHPPGTRVIELLSWAREIIVQYEPIEGKLIGS